MPRLFFVSERISSSPVTLTGDEVHHLRVMRLGPGDCIYITDGSGLRYRAEILEMTRARSTMKILAEEPLPPRSRPRIMLAQAIPRYSAIEVILQKATELGVDCIYPLQTDRSFSPRTTSLSHHRWQRWERIVIEAAKQSGRIDIPSLATPQPLEDFLHREGLMHRERISHGEKPSQGRELLHAKNPSHIENLSHGRKFLDGEDLRDPVHVKDIAKGREPLHEDNLLQGRGNHLHREDISKGGDHLHGKDPVQWKNPSYGSDLSRGEDPLNVKTDSYFKFCLWEGADPHQRMKDVFSGMQRPESILILVGPEGSFSPDELELISESGCHLISCGYRIMRVETAALMAVSVCQYEWGDL